MKAPSVDTKQLLLNFENIGRNCEFGLLQRYAGAEPLGLLRWSSVGVASLLSALRAKFDGFGTPEQSEILIERGEYWIKDIKYNILSHTSIRDVKANIDYVEKKQYPLLQYLKNGLISALENGNKIFVYQHRDLSRESILELNDAIQSYGFNLLLCVRHANTMHPAGEIELVNENLLIGYIDHEGVPQSDRWDLSTEMWMTFVGAAYGHWKILGRAPATG